MDNMRIVKQKSLLELAMDLYFLNGVKSDKENDVSDASIRMAYDNIFGAGESQGLTEQIMINNALDSHEELSRILDGLVEKKQVDGSAVDDLIITQKRLLNIVKELCFVNGRNCKGLVLKGMMEDVLIKQYESEFGEGSSKGKSLSRLAGDVLAKYENSIYFELEDRLSLSQPEK